MADLTDAEKAAAEQIVLSWNWQVSEGHNYRFKHGLHALTRFYESAPMEADEFKLVLRYLSTQDPITLINVNHKGISLDGLWRAKDSWYQTVNGDRFEGSDTNRVRIYQTIVGKDDDTADGPYLVENGCKYKISHTFFWDVQNLPDLTTGEYVSSSGIQYSLQGVNRDRETGLFSCVIEKRETVQQDIDLYNSAETIFELSQRENHLGVKKDNVDSTGLKASVNNGVLVERVLSKNPDCTTDIDNRMTTEKPVESAVKGWRKTLRGTVETTTDRNQEKSLDGDGLKVGESRQSEKTPGGLYNNTTSLVTNDPAGKIAADCVKTIFEHQHTETKNELNAPETDDVDAAAGGVIKRQSSRETEEGTWDVTTTETTETPVASSVKVYRKTLRGTVETTTDRNQTDPLNSTNMKVGETRQSEKTPGGLFNNTKISLSNEAAGNIAQSCEKAEKEHTDSSVDNQLSKPDSVELTSSNNVVKSQTARQTEDGSWDVVTTTKTYSEREATITWKSGGGTYSHTTFAHKTAIPTVTAPTGGSASATVSQNITGTFDGSYQTFTPDSGPGTTAGVIIQQEGTITLIEIDKLPGGAERRRKVTIDYEQGTASGATALLRAKDGYAYKQFVSHASCSPDGRVGQWIKYSEPTFGAWETVS